MEEAYQCEFEKTQSFFFFFFFKPCERENLSEEEDDGNFRLSFCDLPNCPSNDFSYCRKSVYTSNINIFFEAI